MSNCSQFYGEVPEFDFKFSSIVGRRDNNEDAHVTFKFKNMWVAGIFDGHNGPSVAQYCAKNLEFFLQQYKNEQKTIEEILKDTIFAINKAVMEQFTGNQAGSTAVIVAMDSDEKEIHVVNVGDSRCVIGYSNKIVSTRDHKPEYEAERLKKAGAYIELMDGVWRINKVISVARSIGDSTFKAYGVICDPDYYKFPLQDCQYVILGCDGLFDVVSNEQLDSYVKLAVKRDAKTEEDRKFLKILDGDDQINNTQIYRSEGKIHQKLLFDNVIANSILPKRIAQTLTRTAYDLNSLDNVSVACCLVGLK
ncbi:Protein_phosphatase 2C [Hexamita inflata]|uniref:Protein phosphatase 2C n=1 Tax=Hexamita inflata TaxID=28002 RepID=A0AA86R0S1_9EUKA|nr:Protein phosphatase 2C [Hexamita inflata]